MDDCILLAITGWPKGVALANAHSVARGHGVDRHVANFHADDEAASRAHAHTHGCCEWRRKVYYDKAAHWGKNLLGQRILDHKILEKLKKNIQ